MTTNRRRRWPWLLALVVLIGLGVVGGAIALDRGSTASATRSRDSVPAPPTQPIVRRTLSETTSVNGTLGYAGNYVIQGHLPGTLTWLPPVGQVIQQGEVAYRVDGHPVALLYGPTPAYRALAAGATAADVVGTDVSQLNHDLVTLGLVTRSAVDSPWRDFGWATTVGVEKLQARLGVEPTGSLRWGQVIFLPTAARITSVPALLGGPASGPVLSATSTTREVSVNLPTDLQSGVKAGDPVRITLPDTTSTPGVVTSIGSVATTASSSGPGADPTPTVAVLITPNRPDATGRIDQAPVQVAITTASVPDALAVPVSALLALAGGGYALEVVATDGTHRLVRVSLGLFDDADGLVQVIGSGLVAGQSVVVAGS